MAQDMKMYGALGVLVVLGGAYYMQLEGDKREAKQHSIESASSELPELALSEEATGKVTKIVIEKPAKKEGDKETTGSKNVLIKEGDKWQLKEPVAALANQQNVESLLKNLTKLSAKEQIAKGKESFEQYEVSAGAALHAVFYEGDKVVREIWAGKSGGRGQMARVDGSDSVFALDGYSSFLYGRDTKGWRDLSILELDPEEATSVSIKNEHGEFSFAKEGDEWSGKFKGEKAFALSKIKEFEAKKVEDLLKAYKKLNASDFGDGKTFVETGLEEPKAKITVQLGKDKTVVVEYGENAEGSSRWAKIPGTEQIYSISSWASDWAFAEEEKFQKSDEPEKPPGGAPPGMPPGMQMPPGMAPPGAPH